MKLCPQSTKHSAAQTHNTPAAHLMPVIIHIFIVTAVLFFFLLEMNSSPFIASLVMNPLSVICAGDAAMPLVYVYYIRLEAFL